MQFWASHGSSLFQNKACQFPHFSDYIIAHYVIGHDVIGHPKVGTENSGVDLYDTETRLALDGLE